MQLEPEEAQQIPAVAAFIAELRHWREVTGYSQKALAKLVGYTPSYVSKVERGTMAASREFAAAADEHLHAGRAIIRLWRPMHEALFELSGGKARHDEPAGDDPQSAPGPDLVVEHEQAELVYRDGVYRTHIRRLIRNTGDQPVTQYLIRIAVDHHPGDPERSHQLYRDDPLTWEEIGLSATCGEETMSWRVKSDQAAFKEVWLLFENADGRFPLYPGESTWISYVYTVEGHKWGPWWQRAVRLPDASAEHDRGVPCQAGPGGLGDHHVDDGRVVAVPDRHRARRAGRPGGVHLVNRRAAAACAIPDRVEVQVAGGGGDIRHGHDGPCRADDRAGHRSGG